MNLLGYKCRSDRQRKQITSFYFIPLKNTREIFRPFCITSGLKIVILCFPQTLKNDFMLIAAWSKENGNRLDFPLDSRLPIFPGWVSREQGCTVSLVSRRWSLLMLNVSGPFSSWAIEGPVILPSPSDADRLSVGGRGHLEQVWRCCLCYSFYSVSQQPAPRAEPICCYWIIQDTDLPSDVYKLSHVAEW